MLRLLKLDGSTVWRSGTRSSSAIMARNPVLTVDLERSPLNDAVRSYPFDPRDAIPGDRT